MSTLLGCIFLEKDVNKALRTFLHRFLLVTDMCICTCEPEVMYIIAHLSEAQPVMLAQIPKSFFNGHYVFNQLYSASLNILKLYTILDAQPNKSLSLVFEICEESGHIRIDLGPGLAGFCTLFPAPALPPTVDLDISYDAQSTVLLNCKAFIRIVVELSHELHEDDLLNVMVSVNGNNTIDIWNDRRVIPSIKAKPDELYIPDNTPRTIMLNLQPKQFHALSLQCKQKSSVNLLNESLRGKKGRVMVAYTKGLKIFSIPPAVDDANLMISVDDMIPVGATT